MPIDKALFRQVAGSFASGVTVITTGFEGKYHGMTASAFCSLSLDPLQVLVCVDRTAHTLPLLQQSGHFNVNILASGQEEISRIFANKEAAQRVTFEGIEHTLNAKGVPLLKGALASFECRVALQFDGGDHVIVVGEVEDGDLGDGDDPLLYFRSRYRSLADD
jgi:flavin reductase (DIM6/NTAB) family NADH-FMN oxidoreductase RutF